MKTMLSHGFWIGAVVSMAVYSLIQDFLGRDKFVAIIRDGWVDAAYSVPIAGGLLAAAVVAYFFLRLRASDADDFDDDGPTEARKKTSGEIDDIIRRASGVRRG